MEIIKLPPYNSITGKYMTKTGHYNAYRVWRQSPGYVLWRNTQWRIQKGRCYYCKTSLSGRVSNVEHVLNQGRGGETIGKNMVISCAPCNKAKGSNLASKQLRHNVTRFNHNKRAKKRRQKI